MATNIFATTFLVSASRSGTLAATVVVGLACVSAAGCDRKDEQPVAPTAIAPRATAAVGSVSTVLGRGTFASPVSVKRQTGHWRTDVEGDPMDVAVQSIVFQPGGQSGWHAHPGPVFILVVQGTMTFYDSSDPHCRPIVRTAGQGFLDTGDHAHIARNETQVESRNVVTYFAPVGAALRIDAHDPGTCPFAG